MPVIKNLMQKLSSQRPLDGIRMSGCLHITTETANLAPTPKAAGADLVLCASNPLSTQDDVAAALVEKYHIPALESLSVSKSRPREFVDEYTLKDGRTIRLLAEGRLVNLAAAEGHPSAVMDVSFANQVLSAIYMKNNHGKLSNTVHNIPEEIDQKSAQLKLDAMGIKIDQLTNEQQRYLSSWQEGTS